MAKKTPLPMDHEILTHSQSDMMVSYVGPKALFDPNFIPTKIISRKKQSQLLNGIIQDAVTDHYSTNVSLYGLKGSGKNLIINRFLESLPLIESKTEKHNSKKTTPLIIRIDCNKKELSQVFFQIISQINDTQDNKLQINEYIKLDNAKLWNLLKFLVQKITRSILIYLQSPENLESLFLSKMFSFAKSTKNLQIVTSLNTGAQRYSFREYEDMDHRIQLDSYSINELAQITSDRCMMAFPKLISPDAIQLITDYVSEYDTKVPGSYINYLKELYPILQQNQEVQPEDLRSLSQYHFEGFSLDALGMADFVINTSIEDRLFLDYIINYFNKSEAFYIPFMEIKRAYIMTGEELGFKPFKNEFFQSLGKIVNAQILQPSAYAITNSDEILNGIHTVPHYLTLPINEVSEIMKVSFGDFGEEQSKSKNDRDNEDEDEFE